MEAYLEPQPYPETLVNRYSKWIKPEDATYDVYFFRSFSHAIHVYFLIQGLNYFRYIVS